MILDESGDPPFVRSDTHMLFCIRMIYVDRGATVERLVELLTNNYRLLWEGVDISNKEKWREVMGAISEQELLLLTVIDFCLTMYRSFVEPIIFLRLLLHRLVITLGNYHTLMELNAYVSLSVLIKHIFCCIFKSFMYPTDSLFI